MPLCATEVLRPFSSYEQTYSNSTRIRNEFIYIVRGSSLPPNDIYSFSRAALTNSLKFYYQVSVAVILVLGRVLTGVPKPVTASQPA